MRGTLKALDIVAIVCAVIATVLVVVFAFKAYPLLFGGVSADDPAQVELRRQLDMTARDVDTVEGAAGSTSDSAARLFEVPDSGQALVALDFPRVPSMSGLVAVEGIELEDIAHAPGHDPSTELPGQVGNAVFAGHQDGVGSSFNDLGKLQVCDPVVVETPTQLLTYRVLPDDRGAVRGVQAWCFSDDDRRQIVDGDYSAVMGKQVVSPGDVFVTYPVPVGGRDGHLVSASHSIVTLYTCYPRFSNTQRLVVHAWLTEVEDKEEK